MKMDDMILVSIDDHMVEPPDMYVNHVPARWRDEAPMVMRSAEGVDEWEYNGKRSSTPFGMAATVGWPQEEWGFNPVSYVEMRPGCFNVHERIRDMNANGVLASMNFPTMAGFNARTFNEASDRESSLVMVRAYNDWAIDEWAGAYPDRFIPLALVPMWDVELAVAEIQRVTTWPYSPETIWQELQAAECSDSDIHKITWENACRFYDWDPFARTDRTRATVGALRAAAADVDVERVGREEWRRRNTAEGIGVP